MGAAIWSTWQPGAAGAIINEDVSANLKDEDSWMSFGMFVLSIFTFGMVSGLAVAYFVSKCWSLTITKQKTYGRTPHPVAAVEVGTSTASSSNFGAIRTRTFVGAKQVFLKHGDFFGTEEGSCYHADSDCRSIAKSDKLRILGPCKCCIDFLKKD